MVLRHLRPTAREHADLGSRAVGGSPLEPRGNGSFDICLRLIPAAKAVVYESVSLVDHLCPEADAVGQTQG